MRGPQSIAYAFNRLVDGSLWLTIILFFTALIPLSAQSVPDYNWLKGVDLGSAGIFSLNNIAISVDADSKGNVYVLTFGGSLKKYDKNGNSMGVISLNADLESPVDLAINSKDEFFVADHEKRIVYAFDLNGNLLTGKSKTSGYFKPLGITFDKDDNLYVLDYNDGSGAEDTQSSRLKIYYSNGSASDDLLVNYLTQPYRIAVDSKGSIYISHVGDDEKGEVLVFNSDYQFIEVLQGMGSPGSIEIDAFDFIHVMDYSNKLNLSKILSRDIGYLFGAIGEIQNGIEENEFSIKIYDVTRNLIKTFKEEIDLPLDVAFGFCANKMYVNNARITDSSELQFDLEIYERTLSFDTQNPVLTCLGDFTVFLPAGQNHITLSFSSARVSDNCSATVTQTEGPSSGSQVTAGNYEIKFTAEDEAGNTSVCSFFILVAEEDSEKEANFNNCPSEISTVTDPNDCGAIVSYNAPTASEGGDDLEVTRTSGLDPGSLFPVGITTVTYEATASDGEILTCSFDVVVTDNQAPEISCPADIEVTAQPGEDFAVVDFPDATATDNCSVTIVQTSGLSSGSEFEIGTHIIEFTATDPSGKTDVCSFKITVKEPESPSFECPAEEGLPVLELDQNCGLTIPDYDYLLTSFENFQNEEFLVQSQVRVGNLLEVTIEVYDGEGGAFVNSCEFDIQIVDSIEPTIECPGSPQSIAMNGEGKYILPDYRDRVSDNCDEDPEVVQMPPPGEITEGTTVTLVATDEAGNTSVECSFAVVLEQVEAPSFVCPEEAELPGLEVDENCDIPEADYRTYISGFENFKNDPVLVQEVERLGMVLQVQIEVFDGSGGPSAGTCEFEIQLIDNIPPQFDCPSNPVNISPDSEGNYILPDFRTGLTDNCGGIFNFNQSPSPGTELTEGGMVLLSATDVAGNENTCEFEVVLLQEGEPSFNCPTGNEIPELTLDESCDYDLPELKDLVSDFQNFENSAYITTRAEQIDNYLQVQIRVYDGSEEAELLVGECNFTIELIDATPPVARCVSGITVQLDQDGSVSISPEDLDNGSFDSCGNVSLSLSQSTFTAADIQNSPVIVNLIVTDDAGNSTFCLTQVTVEPYNPEEPPGFSCIESLSLSLDAEGEAVLDVDQLYQGSLGPDASVSVDKEVFTCDDIGQQTVTLTYSGSSSGSCTITITVTDETSPEARARDIEVFLNENGAASITAADLDDGSTDNCGIADLEFQISESSFTCNDIGENILEFEVTDGSGNSSVTSVTVTVRDPQGVCESDPVEPPAEGRFVILYPNPSRGEVQIATSPGIVLQRVEIFDMRGRFLDLRELNFNPQTKSYSLDLKNYQTGVYTLKLYSEEREYIRRAIISTY